MPMHHPWCGRAQRVRRYPRSAKERPHIRSAKRQVGGNLRGAHKSRGLALGKRPANGVESGQLGQRG